MRAIIDRGLLVQGHEPADLPGAYVLTWHEVSDAAGAVDARAIAWNGPAEWIESRDGVPPGHVALWLGTRASTRPLVVFVRQAPTPESAMYERGYRRGWRARRRPDAGRATSEAEVDGIMQGWRDSPNNRDRGRW